MSEETRDEDERPHADARAAADALRELMRGKALGFAESVRKATVALEGIREGFEAANEDRRHDVLPLRGGEESYVVRVTEAWEAAHAEVPLRAILTHIDYDDHGDRVDDGADHVWLGGKRFDVTRGEWWVAYAGLGGDAVEIGYVARDGAAFIPHAKRSWGHQRLGRVHGRFFALEALRREAGR